MIGTVQVVLWGPEWKGVKINGRLKCVKNREMYWKGAFENTKINKRPPLLFGSPEYLLLRSFVRLVGKWWQNNQNI